MTGQNRPGEMARSSLQQVPQTVEDGGCLEAKAAISARVRTLLVLGPEALAPCRYVG